jgi:hypothetical protein
VAGRTSGRSPAISAPQPKEQHTAARPAVTDQPARRCFVFTYGTWF